MPCTYLNTLHILSLAIIIQPSEVRILLSPFYRWESEGIDNLRNNECKLPKGKDFCPFIIVFLKPGKMIGNAKHNTVC